MCSGNPTHRATSWWVALSFAHSSWVGRGGLLSLCLSVSLLDPALFLCFILAWGCFGVTRVGKSTSHHRNTMLRGVRCHCGPQAVFAGKSGSIPASTLIPITDELLAKERAEKDTEIEESRKQKEANLEAAKSDIEAEERAKLDKLSEKERAQAMASAASGEAGQSEEDKMAAAASAAAAVRPTSHTRRSCYSTTVDLATLSLPFCDCYSYARAHPCSFSLHPLLIMHSTHVWCAPPGVLQAKMKEENAALLAEENRLKAEAARLEELMRQLDMSDDDDDEM